MGPIHRGSSSALSLFNSSRLHDVASRKYSNGSDLSWAVLSVSLLIQASKDIIWLSVGNQTSKARCWPPQSKEVTHHSLSCHFFILPHRVSSRDHHFASGSSPNYVRVTSSFSSEKDYVDGSFNASLRRLTVSTTSLLRIIIQMCRICLCFFSKSFS